MYVLFAIVGTRGCVSVTPLGFNFLAMGIIQGQARLQILKPRRGDTHIDQTGTLSHARLVFYRKDFTHYGSEKMEYTNAFLHLFHILQRYFIHLFHIFDVIFTHLFRFFLRNIYNAMELPDFSCSNSPLSITVS